MTLKLSRQVTKLIIYLLRRNECLWDVTNAHYSIRASRQEALMSMTKEISKICPQVTINDVREKIKNIRTQYRRQIIIIEKSKRDFACGRRNEKKKKSTWWCFEHLNFLMPIIRNKDDVSNENTKLSTISEDSMISRSFDGHKSLCSWTYKERFKYFERNADDSACCKLCKSVLKCTQSTAPLARHLYHCHQIDTSYNGAEKSRFLKSRQELKRLDAELRHDKPNVITNSNFDLLITDSEDELEINASCTDTTKERYSHADKMPINEFFEDNRFESFDEALIEVPPQNNLGNIESAYSEYHEAETDRSSPAAADEYCSQMHKLKAETRYYNEMADLARAKRILIELQSDKLRLELAEMHNS